jgi:hypothetical protein
MKMKAVNNDLRFGVVKKEEKKRRFCGYTRERDKMLWFPVRNHRFEVKSYYYILQFGESSLFPWKSIWKVKTPTHIAFFTWTTTLGKILMIDNL